MTAVAESQAEGAKRRSGYGIRPSTSLVLLGLLIVLACAALIALTVGAAGIPLGPGSVLDALSAVTAAHIGTRDDFYWTLHSVFVNRRDQREIFDQAFHVYWRNPRLLEKMMEMLLPSVGMPAE